MKLKISQIRELQNALASLDGIHKEVKVNEKESKIILQPFKFNGKVKWNIAHNLSILSVYTKRFADLQDALIKEISDGKDSIEENETQKIKEFTTKVNQILRTDEEVEGLRKFKEEDFDLDKNTGIPQTILSLLSQYLVEIKEDMAA